MGQTPSTAAPAAAAPAAAPAAAAPAAAPAAAAPAPAAPAPAAPAAAPAAAAPAAAVLPEHAGMVTSTTPPAHLVTALPPMPSSTIPAPPTELLADNLFSENPTEVRSELETARRTLSPEQFLDYINTMYHRPILPDHAIVRNRYYGMTPLAFKVFDGFPDDDQATKDARFEIIDMYLQIPGIDVNAMGHAFLTKTLLSSAIQKQHECFIEDRVLERLLAHASTDLITSSPIDCALVMGDRHAQPYSPRNFEYPPVEHDLTIVRAILDACKARGTAITSACVNEVGTRTMVSPLFSAARYVLDSQAQARETDAAVYTAIVDALLEHGARIRDGSQPQDLEKGEFLFTQPMMHGTGNYRGYGRHAFAMSGEDFAKVVSFVESRKRALRNLQRQTLKETLPYIASKYKLPENIGRTIAQMANRNMNGGRRRTHKRRHARRRATRRSTRSTRSMRSKA